MFYDCLLHIFRVDHPLGIHGKVGHLETSCLQIFAGIEDRVMLNGRGNDVIFSGHFSKGNPHQGHVIRFGTAAGKDDFSGIGANQGGYLPPRCFDGLLRPPPEAVNAGGIPEMISEIAHHGPQDLRVDGGRGAVIKVDGIHGFPTFLFFLFHSIID